MPLCQKKNQRWFYPTKIHLKAIDILDWLSRKSSNNSLYFYGDLSYIAFQRKKTGNLIYGIEVWLLLQFIRLDVFYKEESSILCTIQPSGVLFGGVLERQSRELFVYYEKGYNFENVRVAVKTF